MEAWVGLLGALAGTAIGGFVTYTIAMQQHSHERLVDMRNRKIEAMEAIYVHLSSVNAHASSLNIGVIGDLGYNVPFKADYLKEKIQFDRLQMLVSFYTPALQPSIREMSKQLAIIGQAITEVVLEKDRNEEWKTNTVKKATLASMEMQKLANEAQEKLGEQMRALDAES